VTKTYESKKTGNPTEDKKLFEDLMKEKGLNNLLDSDGLPDISKFEQFLVVTAYGVDKDDKFEKSTNGNENNFISEIDPDENILSTLKEGLSTDNKKSNYKIDAFGWYNPGDWFSNYDKIYKGNLYIPISTNQASGVFAGKKEVPY